MTRNGGDRIQVHPFMDIRIPRWRAVLRLATLAAAFGVLGWAATGLARRGDGDAGGIASPPPGADDPLNPAVFIRGGTFMRGSNDAGDPNPASPYATFDEQPAHPSTVASFWMQQHEVTNEEYRRFDVKHVFPAGEERHPVANITWRTAMAYATSLGGRLATEGEWEFAARGRASRRFPWGDAKPTCELVHYVACDPRRPIEVMSLPAGATPEGIHDLAGNVWEWVMPDWFRPGRTPVNKASRRLRGGSFLDDAFFLRASNRNNEFFAGFKFTSIGFRVVWPVE